MQKVRSSTLLAPTIFNGQKTAKSLRKSRFFVFLTVYSGFIVKGAKPVFKETLHGFELTIPLATPQGVSQATPNAGTKSALSGHQVAILHNCLTEKAIEELMQIECRSDRTKFRNQVLNPLLDAGLIEMTIPDKPRSRLQKYRLTPKGQNLLASSKDRG